MEGPSPGRFAAATCVEGELAGDGRFLGEPSLDTGRPGDGSVSTGVSPAKASGFGAGELADMEVSDAAVESAAGAPGPAATSFRMALSWTVPGEITSEWSAESELWGRAELLDTPVSSIGGGMEGGSDEASDAGELVCRVG
jgi:hypothetical protein